MILDNSNFKDSKKNIIKEPNSKEKSNNSSVKLRSQRRKEKKLIKEAMEIPDSWGFYRKPNGFVSIVGEIADSEENINETEIESK